MAALVPHRLHHGSQELCPPPEERWLSINDLRPLNPDGDGDAGCGTRLATAGYAVYGVDYEGHGKSAGARCYIRKFDHLVADCEAFFKSVCGR